MTKSKILTLCVTILLTVSMIIIVISFKKAGNDVSFNLSVQQGSLSDIDGLKIHLEPYVEELSWSGDISVSKQGISDNVSMFGPSIISDDNDYPLLYLQTLNTDPGNWKSENEDKLKNMLNELLKENPSGGDISVPLSDYYPYVRFTLQGYIRSSKGGFDFDNYGIRDYSNLKACFKKDYFEDVIEPEYIAENKMRELFKVRVPQNAMLDIRYGIDSKTDEMFYYLDDHNYLSNFKLHFSIDENSLIMWFTGAYYDVSEMPGGYGIYILPYKGKKISKYLNLLSFDFENVKNILPLNITDEILNVKVEKKYKELLIFTKEDEAYRLYVLDTDSYSLKQTLEYNKFGKNIRRFEHEHYENGTHLVITGETEFINGDEYHIITSPGVLVIQRGSDGKYSEVFSNDTFDVIDPNGERLNHIEDFLMKDGKLLLCFEKQEDNIDRETCEKMYSFNSDNELHLYLLSETETLFHGKLTSSLMDANIGHYLESTEDLLHDNYLYDSVTRPVSYNIPCLIWD